MAKAQNGEEILPKVQPLSRVKECYRGQTDDRRICTKKCHEFSTVQDTDKL